MAEIKEQFERALFYKERFEFRLTVGDDIICQRYFKIGKFNPLSLKSVELVDTIRSCADMIDRDLKSKTLTYLDLFAPRVFESMEEFEKYIESDYNRKNLICGEGIVIRTVKDNDFAWNGEDKLIPLDFKFEDGEFSQPLTEDDYVTYKFAFLDSGREVCSTTWVGVYPRFVRNSIDLSNKRGRLGINDVYRVGFELYLLYKLVEGRADLVPKIVKEICYTCSEHEDSWYTTTLEYRDAKSDKTYTYNNRPFLRRS